jgi:hypothetical protein
MNLFVNTISFNGEKAVINSYSGHPSLVEGMNSQRQEWAAMFPNAVVATEIMLESQVIALLAEGAKRRQGDGYSFCYSHCHEVGVASQ